MSSSTTAPLDPLHVVLANGISVWVDRFADEPRVAWRVVVRAGAAADPDGQTGAAHLAEHILANKGSQRLGTRSWTDEAPLLDAVRPLSAAARTGDAAAAAALDAAEARVWDWVIPGELKKLAGELGATGLNAATSHDRTWYRVDLPANRVEAWARVDADRFAAPVVRAFTTELHTVCEEKRRGLDHAGRALSEALSAALWGAHPYGRPILGHPRDLERLDVAAMEAYLARWYRPSQMAVCVSGDVDPQAIARLVEETFGQLQEPDGAPPPLAFEAPERAADRVSVVHQADEEVRLAWRTVPRGHADVAGLQLAHGLLSDRSIGWLARRLVHTRRVRAASGYRSAQRFGGTLALRGQPGEGQTLSSVEGLLSEAMDALLQGDVRADDLAALQRNLQLQEQRALERIDQRAAWLARAYTFGEAFPDAGRWADRLAVWSVDEVVSAAQRHLGAPPTVARRLRGDPTLPDVRPPAVTAREAPDRGARSAFRDEILAMQVEPLAGQALALGDDAEDVASPIGRVIHGDNPYNGLFQLSLVWDTGSDDRRGLGAAGGLWGHGSAGALDRTALERTLAGLGVGVHWRIGRRRTSITVSGLGASAEQGLALLGDRVQASRVPTDVRERHLADLLARRQERKSTREARTGAVQALALRGADSPWRDRALTDAEVHALAPDGELAPWFSPLASTLPTATLLVGRLDRGAVVEALGAWLEPRGPAPTLSALRYAPIAQDTVWLVHQPAAQASVMVLQPLGPTRAEDAPARRILSEAWGGSAGLFFHEVRERRGWAYSVTGRISASPRAGDDSLRWAQAATDPERAGDCAALLVALLRERALERDHLDRARASSIEKLRAHRVTFRSVPAALLGWEEAGYDGDPRPAWLDALPRVSASAVERVRRDAADRPVHICVVGDTARIDGAALRALGAVRAVTDADLFAY